MQAKVPGLIHARLGCIITCTLWMAEVVTVRGQNDTGAEYAVSVRLLGMGGCGTKYKLQT